MNVSRMMSRLHDRRSTTKPPQPPPRLLCERCDSELLYRSSNIGGVSAKHAEQWDYFECPTGCGVFQYRHRTRKVRRVTDVFFPLPAAARLCVHCGEIVRLGEAVTAGSTFHRECLVRLVVGSVGHQLKLCSCYGGDYEDPPSMSTREAARAAEDLYNDRQRAGSQ